MVDPAGLKPAPHGLKGRCSVTRAPDQKIGCGGRIRTFGSRINSAVPYQLGDATKRKKVVHTQATLSSARGRPNSAWVPTLQNSSARSRPNFARVPTLQKLFGA